MNRLQITENNNEQPVSIDPNDIFAQFGLSTSDSTSQNVSQRVGSIEVDVPHVNAEYTQVEPEYLELINDETRVLETSNELVDQIVNFNSTIQATDSSVSLENEESNISEENIIIPLNKQSYLIDETTSRFSGAAWFEEIQNSSIILAGIGGIGSFCLFMLSRMHPKQIFIYDDDRVELGNLSGQLYSKSMIGKYKVDAMASMVTDFSNYHSVMACRTKFEETSISSDIMICGFDNMGARKTFFNAWYKHVLKSENPEKCLFIDARLAAEEFQVFCMTGIDKYYIEEYKSKYLFSDLEADATICSYKQTSYCANMIGSIMVNLYTNFIANTLNPIIKRDLPFKTYYDASLMFFKTES